MTCARCGSDGFGCYECTPDPFAIIARLTAERDAALAQVVGAYEAAAQALEAPEWSDCGCMDAGCRGRHAEKLEALEFAAADIRALTPADATAALDSIKRQARAEGMRIAATICNRSYGDGLGAAHKAILAAADREERGDE